jgi:hypothetical protein
MNISKLLKIRLSKSVVDNEDFFWLMLCDRAYTIKSVDGVSDIVYFITLDNYVVILGIQ